jgi:hypothetical protein
VAQESSCFLGVTWHGEAWYGLGVQGVKTLIPVGAFFPANYGFSISARFSIHGAHPICFCTIVAILDPPTFLDACKNPELKLLVANP